MKLYEINHDIEKLVDESIDLETGEVLPETSEYLERLYADKAKKVTELALFIKNEVAMTDAIDKEIEKLEDKKRSIKKKVQWLKDYLQKNLEVGEKIETSNYTISWRKSDSIEISDLVILEDLYEQDPRFVTKKVVYSADKIAAKKIYKDTGILPEGFSFIEKQNLQVR